MSIHLSSEQISKLMIGEATAEEERHARECIECMNELARFRTTLSVLRDSVQNWTAESSRSIAPDRALQAIYAPGFRIRLRGWAVAAAMIGLLAIPIYRNIHQPQRAPQVVEDTLLLEQVNAHLSRSVAAPIEPLMQLISDVPAEQTGGHK
jgi:hypothetical protein